MDCSPQAPLSMGFSGQEYWRGLPCPPPGDLPDPGIEPTSPMSSALAGGFFTTSAIWEALLFIIRFLKITLFIWLRWVFVAARAFSSCSKQGLLSSCGVRASCCSSFSCCKARAAAAQASAAVACGLCSCGSQAQQLLCSMRDLPGPGVEPVSPALAGGFFTTEPPGMPPGMIIFVIVLGPWGPYPFILLIVFWFPLVTSCLLLGAASDWAFTSVKLLCFTPVGRQTYSSSSLYSLIRT